MSEAARVRNSETLAIRNYKNPKSRKRKKNSLTVRKPNLLAAVDIVKSYRKGKMEVPVLKGVNFRIAEGELTAIVGQSGSGKSTLLHLLGTLDQPDSGEIWFDDECTNQMPSIQRDRLRNQHIGLIFQFYHLLPELTTLENVMVPRMIRRGVFGFWKKKNEYKERAEELLEKVGLSHRLTHKPRQLSGGEMQRAAIARALITKPKLLLADEPTGNLDGKNGNEVLKTLMELKEQENLTVVMVTHDDNIAARADRTIRLVEGKVKKS